MVCSVITIKMKKWCSFILLFLFITLSKWDILILYNFHSWLWLQLFTKVINECTKSNVWNLLQINKKEVRVVWCLHCYTVILYKLFNHWAQPGHFFPHPKNFLLKLLMLDFVLVNVNTYAKPLERSGISLTLSYMVYKDQDNVFVSAFKVQPCK